MLVTFDEYSALGFCAADEKDFGRFLAMAEAAVSRYTFGRVGPLTITDRGKYGVCELLDAFAAEHKRGRMTAFSNDGYSEHFADYEKLAKTAEERAEDIVCLYFERADVCRGARARV